MTFWHLVSSLYPGCLFWVHFKLFFCTSWGHLETAPLTSAHVCYIPQCFMTAQLFISLYSSSVYNDSTADIFSHMGQMWVRVLCWTLSLPGCWEWAAASPINHKGSSVWPVMWEVMSWESYILCTDLSFFLSFFFLHFFFLI